MSLLKKVNPVTTDWVVTLIFAFGWHWGVGALVGGGLLTAAFVFNAFRAFAGFR